MSLQEWVEATFGVERVQVVAAADVLVVDEYLWDRATAAGALGHRVASGFIAVDGYLLIGYSFGVEKGFRSAAVRAGLPGVDFDFWLMGHGFILSSSGWVNTKFCSGRKVPPGSHRIMAGHRQPTTAAGCPNGKARR